MSGNVVDDACIEPSGSDGSIGTKGGKCSKFKGTQIERTVQADIEAYSESPGSTGKAGGLRRKSLNGGAGDLPNCKSGGSKAPADLKIGSESNTFGNETDAQRDKGGCASTVASAVGATRIDAGLKAALNGKVIERAANDSTGIALCRTRTVVAQDIVVDG